MLSPHPTSSMSDKHRQQIRFDLVSHMLNNEYQPTRILKDTSNVPSVEAHPSSRVTPHPVCRGPMERARTALNNGAKPWPRKTAASEGAGQSALKAVISALYTVRWGILSSENLHRMGLLLRMGVNKNEKEPNTNHRHPMLIFRWSTEHCNFRCNVRFS